MQTKQNVKYYYNHVVDNWWSNEDIARAFDLCALFVHQLVREPESYTEAAKDANWHVAMNEEMRVLDANDTWDLVDPPW